MMRTLLHFLMAFLVLSCDRTTRFELLEHTLTGIDFSNTVMESDSFHIMVYEYIYNGAGVGIGDLNNDGLPDIVFAANQESPSVYLNAGNFRFCDITANFRGMTNDQCYSGVTLVDINHDRWLDVLITAAATRDSSAPRNRLWINQGVTGDEDPVFIDMAEEYGIAETGHSIQAAFFDYDLDGDLDVYFLNNIYSTNDHIKKTIPAVYRKRISDGSAITNDRLYRNNGNGSFTDVSREAGINIEGYGLGLAVSDINKDGYPDLYVSNDYISNDLLYINQGDGTFRNLSDRYLSYQTKSSMGNDISDINHDGFPDIYTLDMLAVDIFRKKQTINGFGYIYYMHDEEYGYEHQYIRNMLHLNNGKIDDELLPFSEIGQMLNLDATEWSWSPLFADYDNDGDRDLIITNGYPADLTDKDWTFYRMKTYNIFNTAEQVLRMAPKLKFPNKVYENTGDLTFIDRTEKWLPNIPSYSMGAAFSDLDNDGDLDYVANNLNDIAFILRNQTVEKSRRRSAFVKIKLIGNAPNTMALGAKVEVWCQGNYQYYEHYLTRGYASSVDPVIHFGLGNASLIDSVSIIWPGGKTRSLIRDVAANQVLEVVQETSSTYKQSHQQVTAGAARLFGRCDSVISYLHEQKDFADYYFSQIIIPHKFSQIGPVIRMGDLDGDGLDDLLIGATNLLPTKVFLRRGAQFIDTAMEGLTQQKGISETDLLIIDIDGDGDQDVIAVTGGYEQKSDNDYFHYLYENQNGAFFKRELPIPGFPASVIRPFDFDHDGDIDLFIGSRVKKGEFPFANASWLLVNEEGRFTNTSCYPLDLGMVTDALWSDYNGDGWEDLLITREWNSLALLRNNAGSVLEPVEFPGADKYHGVWYTLVAGDFDGDGDDDYIAGNLGENHRFEVSDQHPLRIYAIDLDQDGKIDPIASAYWPDEKGRMKEYPVNYLDELSAQSIFFKRTFSDYKSFSYTGMDELLTPEVRKHINLILHASTTSSYLIWNDEGRFIWQPLPKAVQYAPLKKIVVRDLNGDGYPDVIMAGNDHTWDVATGLYDANKGIVMLNNGDRTFNILQPAESGLLLQGMVESLLYLDGDTPLVVAGINRGPAVVYELIQRR